jgi:hypothetical protein
MTPEIIIEILILVAAIYLAFFKSYLTEKGKSAALKEDLNELTREVESVKNEFTKEQEILKIDLQRLLTNEVSYRDEERKAIILFHTTISEWIYTILEVIQGNYNKTNIDSLILIRNDISKFYGKAGITKSKISLLVEDSELVKKSHELYSATLTFHHWVDAELFKLQQNLESQKRLTDSFLILIKHLPENDKEMQGMAEDEQDLINARNDLFSYYMANRNHEYFKVKPIEEEFSKQVKSYLKN